MGEVPKSNEATLLVMSHCKKGLSIKSTIYLRGYPHLPITIMNTIMNTIYQPYVHHIFTIYSPWFTMGFPKFRAGNPRNHFIGDDCRWKKRPSLGFDPGGWRSAAGSKGIVWRPAKKIEGKIHHVLIGKSESLMGKINYYNVLNITKSIIMGKSTIIMC